MMYNDCINNLAILKHSPFLDTVALNTHEKQVN